MVFCNLVINFQKKKGKIFNLRTREIKHLYDISSQTWKKSLVEEIRCFLTAVISEFSQVSPLHCPQATTHFKPYLLHIHNILLHMLFNDFQLHLVNFITFLGATSLSVWIGVKHAASSFQTHCNGSRRTSFSVCHTTVNEHEERVGLLLSP